jgi:hypothetical protein
LLLLLDENLYQRKFGILPSPPTDIATLQKPPLDFQILQKLAFDLFKAGASGNRECLGTPQ